MSELEKHLNQLVSCISDWGAPSTWSRALFVEDTSITPGMPARILRSDLVPIEEYATRFDSHLSAGHAWINMSALGILDDSLIIVIELPRYKNNLPREAVSVNFSGPSILNGKPQWDAAGTCQLVNE